MAKNKKKFKITFGLVLFIMVFIYLGYHTISYIVSDKHSIYKVKEITSIDSNDTFTGLIIRSEQVVNSEDTGYINYYLASNSKCAVGDIAYSIDENGSFNDTISSKDGISSLSSDNLLTMTDLLSNYVISYTSSNFSSAYTLKSNINNSLISFLNVADENSLKALGVDTRYFKTFAATSSGIIEYYTDGFEGFNVEDVTADSFDQSKYSKNIIKSKDKVNSGDSAYKLINNEKWSIIIMLDDDTAEKYSGKDRLSIEFSEYGLKTTALFEEFNGADGNKYGKLTLSKYMIQYAESRYLNITVINNNKTGYKIPKSAITTKEFYQIPIEYLTKGGNSSLEGFNIESVTSSGNNVSFKSVDVSYKDDQYVYVAKDQLELGSVLVKPDSDEKAAVSQVSELSGVYQVNQGYAIFKIIDIIDEDSDYAIAATDTSYTIKMYDIIILDGSSISEGEKIY